jgi:PAS domain S-box-containing protein
MKTRQPISQLKNLIRRDLGPQEVAAILDLYPGPCLLVDLSTGFIRWGNSRLTELTGFTKNELQGLKLSTIFPELDPLVSHPGGGENEGNTGIATTIATRLGHPIPVSLRIDPVGTAAGWSFLSVEEQASQKKKQAELTVQSFRWEALHTLLLSTRIQNLQPAFELALEAGHRLSGAGVMAVYRPLGHEANFIRYAIYGQPELLPDTLEGVESVHRQRPVIWTPGKMTTTSLNKAAKTEGFKYLLTYPLIENQAIKGLLVLGDLESNPPNHLLEVSRLIADAVTSSLETKVLISSLTDRIQLNEMDLELGRALTGAVGEGVITTGRNLLVKTINRAADQMLGYRQNEVLNHPIGQILIGPPELDEMISQAKNGWGTQETRMLTLHRRDGNPFPALVRISPVIRREQVDALLIILQDHTEWEGLRKMVERLEPRASLGDSLAEFAHDARNPIAGIESGAELLSRRLSGDQKNLRLIQRIRDDCERLERQIGMILDYSKYTKFNMAPVDLSKLIGNIINGIQHRLDRGHVQVEFHIPDETPEIYGDSSKLELVFVNLINNAIEAMGETGGSLVIKVKPEHQHGEDPVNVRITISDTGPGIPEENLPHIFDPYYTTSPKGTGLGLAIVKRIVDGHEGTIRALSPSGGMIFEIILHGLPQSSQIEEPTSDEEK